ncbi:MAG: hypothetical protein EA397_04690 [Deltaproteobacteria bacterium]|nr:MAG: hypothetical protein EA397_04690 [Deltaproteobacteria bacterium]
MNYSVDQGEWEARAVTGAVLRIAPRGGGGLFVYDALGRAGVAWRIGSLPSEMGGRWILRTIEGGELPIVLILRGQGEASLLSYDERLTHEIWPLQRAEVPLSWVRMAEEPILETLHPLPGGSWLLRSHPEQPARVLHRADQRPSWLPPVSVDDDEPAED